MNKFTYLLFCLILGIGLATAQTTSVTGNVTSSDDGEPIIGASIIVKGTTTGTVTDLDGNFTISNVPSSATTLVISYVGMRQKEVAIQPNVRVVLDPATELLGEVVVTAMGISKEKKALGYAVQNLNSEELTQAATPSLAGALQGKVSGVQITPSSGMPGASSKITIRGSRSFTGDNTPLYVIDGMPIASSYDLSTKNSVTNADYGTRALDIDPNDIESLNILKGQAASALYGMRASNGVIVITTKSGKGARKGKPEVTFNSNVSFDKYSTLPKFQTEYAQGSRDRSVNKYVYSPTASTSWGPKISELANDPVYGGNTDNAYTKNGKKPGMYYVQQREIAGLDPWATPQAYNNAKEFFETGVTWSNNVNVSQAHDKGSYSFSLGNTHQDGIIPNTGMDRYNARLSAEAILHQNWTTGFSGTYSNSKVSKQTGANNGIVATVYGAPASYDLKGIPSHKLNDPYSQNTFRSTSGFDGPYWAVENNEFRELTHRFYGNTFVNYNTKLNTDNHKLSVKYQIGVDSYTTDYIDSYGYGHADGKGEIKLQGVGITEMNSLLTAVYTWNINELFVFDAMIGNEFIQRKKTRYEEVGKDYNFSGWNHIKNSTFFASESETKRKRTVGNFFNLSLAYDNMLYLNVTGRQDKVSNMPRNNRSYFYPSVSLGWIFTELEPLKNNILTYGKIRGSYAEVGMAEDYMDNYYYTPAYTGGFYSSEPIKYPYDGLTSFIPYYTMYDPNLKPQNTMSYEVGLDLTFFGGLFDIYYTFSRQNVKDQIFTVPLARSTGSQYLMTNGGRVHTNAHEISLGINPINTKDFKWGLNFNFSKIDNYVDELADNVESIFLGGFVDPQVRLSIGDKFPVIYGTTYLRNEKGEIVVDDKGLPQGGAEGVIGNVSPDFMLGFSTNFEIYKFRIAATFDWKKGGQMYSGTDNTIDFYGVTQRSADFRNKDYFYFELPAVKKDGTPNDIKIKGQLTEEDDRTKVADAYDYFDSLTGISEAGVRDNGFLKLREISVGYPVWNKRGIVVNVNAFARNIILWSALKGLDPESTQGNTNMGGGFERFSLPGTSSYGFGVNVKF